MFYVLISLLVTVYVLNYLIHNRRSAKLINRLPGPKTKPILGNTLEFLLNPIQFFYAIRAHSNKYRIGNRISRFWLLFTPQANLFDPDDVEILLSSTKSITKGLEYNLVHSWLNTGLLTSTGAKWQKRRKILTPTFHFNILRQFCKIFIERSIQLVNKLENEVGKEETVIRPYITQFTLYTISESAMGVDLDASRSDVAKYVQAIHDIGNISVYRISRIWMHVDSLFNLTSMGKFAKKTINTLHNFTTNIIRERREATKDFINELNIQNFDENIGMKKRLAMLDLLLKAELDGQIHENGIREEVDTFMFEGHDTTNIAITFFLMLIANNPDIQERIVEEQKQIFEDFERKPTVDDFSKMNYLEMCFKESLRLYPSVPFISRTLTEDLQLKKYLLPKGTSVNVHIFDMHRDTRIYLDPLKFDPDRFLPENTRNRHPFSYIPFSGGFRNCIGQKFAVLEAKVVVSAILRKYKLVAVTHPNDIIFRIGILLETIDPVKIKILHRSN